ncbi:hypothetical protein [Microtetraspora sp. NBRC 16547]|uniref:divisome protein SepX/GlpR n=1 Tax=Microtetraspora sp. NBRC 16547 TaxID=3030993 RepID=UPI0024A0B62F|nr:hypothetical protein [Microtetraspora sp. NBRC 16547]GLX02168.1 hypothetical protein Misp02_62540 [Microtetraspora sp. NBRC 16547]
MGSVLLYLAIVVMWLGVLLPMWLRRDKHAIDDLYEDEPAEPAADADTVIESPRAEPSEGSSGTGSASVPLSAPVAEAEGSGTIVAPISEVISGGASGGGSPGDGVASDGASAKRDATFETDATETDGATATSPATGEASPSPADRATRARRAGRRRRAIIIARRRRRLLWSILLVIASTVTAAVRVAPWWAVAPSTVLLVAYLAVLRVAVRVDAERRELAAKARAERLAKQRERRRALEAMAREAEVIMLEARKRVQVFDQYSNPYTDRRAVGD